MAGALVLSLAGCRSNFVFRGDGWHSRGGGHGHGSRGGHRSRGHRVAVEMNKSVIDLSNVYGIQENSAETIIKLANGDNQKNVLGDLGVTASDLQPLTELKMPAQSTIETMSKSLNEDQYTVERIIQDFISDVKAEN